jgi:hypothetical protein
MKTALSALGRFSAIGGLCLLILVLIPIAWATMWANDGALSLAEWALEKADELRGRSR